MKGSAALFRANALPLTSFVSRKSLTPRPRAVFATPTNIRFLSRPSFCDHIDLKNRITCLKDRLHLKSTDKIVPHPKEVATSDNFVEILEKDKLSHQAKESFQNEGVTDGEVSANGAEEVQEDQVREDKAEIVEKRVEVIIDPKNISKFGDVDDAPAFSE